MQTPDPTKIEQQLEAHARNRRRAMGAPFELSPFAQEQLLAEVRRQYQKPPPEPEPRGWRAYAIGLGWTGAAAVSILFMLAPLLSRTASVSDSRTELYAKNERVLKVEPPPSGPRVNERLDPIRNLADKLALATNGAMEAKEKIQLLETRAANSVLPAAPSAAPQPATPPTMMRRYGLVPEPAVKLLTPPLSSPASTYYYVSAVGASNPSAISAGLGEIPNANPLILSSFQLRQDGNAVQIQDEDGSVYVGQVVDGPLKSTVSRDLGRSPATPRGSASAAGRTLAGTELKTAASGWEQNFYFRLAGTNRSLNQKVEIEGQLLADSPPITAATNAKPMQISGRARSQAYGNFSNQAPLSNASQNAAGLNRNHLRFKNSTPLNQAIVQESSPTAAALNMTSNLFSNARIHGQAIVGGTNPIPIDAIPAAE
jgi:hypothetical protein